MLGGVVLLFVHAEHNCEVFVLGGGGDDDFLHAAAQMFPGIGGVGKPPRRFDDDLSSDRVPGQGSGIFLFKNLDGLAVDRNTVGAGGDLVRKVAEDRIVLEQVGQSLGIGEIVHRDEVEVLVGQCGAQDVASNTSESINANFYGHEASEEIYQPKK